MCSTLNYSKSADAKIQHWYKHFDSQTTLMAKPSSCCLTFPASYPLMSLLIFLLHRTWIHRKLFFSHRLCVWTIFTVQTIITPCFSSTYHFSLIPTQHIIMTNHLPLAKLSIQNKICLPAETKQPIKEKKVHSSNPPKQWHPCSLDTLPSLDKKWSAMTHPLRTTVMGFNGMILSYAQYYFHQDRVLLTHGHHRCRRRQPTLQHQAWLQVRSQLLHEWHKILDFANLVLGLDATHDGMVARSKGHKKHDRSYVNMLLTDIAMITNLHPVIHNNNKVMDYWWALAHALACNALLLPWSDALTPSIIQRVWGANNTIWKTRGGPRGDLALIQGCLMLLSKIAINTYHMWATTDFDNAHIINDDALRCYPPGLRSIIKYAQVPLAPRHHTHQHFANEPPEK